ncbi:LysR family transcriptional regulator [Methylophaga muralis]|uniref:Glycine cleavage system transcriptional activator n=1 Tax=Methylophaga muralis TaxID=291169 RepID=A0A1E3GVU0_9GAMM|nr:LysR family transcriptional regulator [Methylophaga muralis]ODN68189.1 Glycine cleavage system transcriptional activator [Methylophaga muralis]
MKKRAVLPDMRAVSAFIEIIRSGSLTFTAEQLDIPKSTLSRRITQLEERIGQKLLRRESNRLIPTQAGQLFADYCQQFIELAQQSQLALDALQMEVSGELNFTFHNAFSCCWLSDKVETLMAEHPKLHLKMRTGFSLPQAAEGESVILWLGKVSDNGLRHECLGQLTQGIYASPHYLQQAAEIIHPRQLIEHKWIDTLDQATQEVTLTHPDEKPFKLPVRPSRMSADQFMMQADAVARGRGLGFYPDWLAELKLNNEPHTLQRCLPEWNGPSLPIWLMYPYGHLSRRTRVFIEHLKAELPAAWNN